LGPYSQISRYMGSNLNIDQITFSAYKLYSAMYTAYWNLTKNCHENSEILSEFPAAKPHVGASSVRADRAIYRPYISCKVDIYVHMCVYIARLVRHCTIYIEIL
jgi:hypothetical protein